MGLISQTAIIKWRKDNIEWYTNKGYKFTKYEDEFEVKVKDLTNGSAVLVEVKCDCENCKDFKFIMWKDYLKCVKEDEKYYCRKCNNIHTRLKNGKSFEQWCINNNRQDILNRWDYKLNTYKPNEITYASHHRYYFKCPRGLHPSELKEVSCFTSGQEGSIKCNQCNSFAQWGIDNICEDFLEKYWDYEKNIIINPWILEKGSSTKKVWIKCQEQYYHGSYIIRPNDFINNKRCSYCNSNSGKVHPLDSLGKLLEDEGLLYLWSDKNKKSPYKYSPNNSKKVYWKCPEGHNDYLRAISNSNTYNFRCPKCVQERDESFLQEKVRLYLEQLNYKLFHEYKCSLKCINPKTNYLLPYDNEIIINNHHLIIEVHGMQHYEVCGFHKHKAKKYNTTPEYQLHYQKLKDRYKRIFAKRQGYFYLEIPYWVDNNEETWRKLIDDKIKEVKLIIERNS